MRYVKCYIDSIRSTIKHNYRAIKQEYRFGLEDLIIYTFEWRFDLCWLIDYGCELEIDECNWLARIGKHKEWLFSINGLAIKWRI